MRIQRHPIAAAISGLGMALAFASGNVRAEVWEAQHVFSVNDVQVTTTGRTFGPSGTYGASGIKNSPIGICGINLPGTQDCPEDGPQPFTDKDQVELYPVTSAFGFNVVDFLGAQAKLARDDAWAEGWVGNIVEDNVQVGIKVSNAETVTYKVKPPMGTWCQGLGGTSIKCSTEHYTVMEHVLSCHEVIPYYYANALTGEQAYLSFPDPQDGFFECSNAALDDNLIIVGGENNGLRLTSVQPGDQIDANDNTTVQEDIAVSADYSVTLKDDGKPLYRWGGLIKRPNDLRFYARIPLPESWKEPGVDIPIESAMLYVDHWITNNPNDQLRPEDLENEAATGRKPSYEIDGTGSWVSTVPCYEGDGDFLPTDEGSEDPQELPVGTVFKNHNMDFALDPNAEPGEERADDPYAFSSDLRGAFTNAFYTTVNRDPFEWSYVAIGATDVFEFVGSPLPKADPAAEGLELVSGPRWRLKANKFGQDIPGLEIPVIECSAPPYGHDNIRYEVGTRVTTVINLLDWEDENSPLATSKGWVDVSQNLAVEVAGTQDKVAPGADPVPYSTNGLPMTDDFDLAVYIKGDRKPTALYSARLVITTADAEE